MTDSAPSTRDEYGHSWGKAYRGIQTCRLCGIPSTSQRADERCLNPYGIVATDDEAKEAARQMIAKHRKSLEKL